MKKFLKTFTVISDKFCDFVNIISMADCIFLMGMIVVDVITGNFFNSPIPGIYEICQVVLTILVFTSWAYAQSKHGHIHVTLFVQRMPQKLRFVCFAITSYLSTIIMAIGTYAVWIVTWSKKSSGECTGTLLIPYWPFYLLEFISFVIFTILLLRDSLKATVAIVDKEMAEEIQASW